MTVARSTSCPPVVARLLQGTLVFQLIGLLAVSPCGAQSTTWSEEQAVAAFLARSPLVAAAKQQVQVAGADVIGAGIRANPVLEVAREQVFPAAGSSEENRLGLQVPISLPGKRDRRVAIAQSGVAIAQARVQERLQELTLEFRSVYGEAYAAAARSDALAADLAGLRRIERVIEARAKAGESAGYDLIRVRLARSAAEARLASERAEAERLRARLVGMADLAATGSLKFATPAPLPPDDDLITYAMAHRAELLAVRAERARADQTIDLAQRLRWPDPAVAVGLKHTSEPTSQGLGYTLGLTWPLPFFDRGQGEAARASAERERLGLQEAAIVARVRNDVPAARKALQQRLDARARFERDALARLPEMTRIAETAYTEGDQGIVTLLDASQAALDTRLQAIDLALSVHSAQLELERQVGAPLTRP